MKTVARRRLLGGLAVLVLAVGGTPQDPPAAAVASGTTVPSAQSAPAWAVAIYELRSATGTPDAEQLVCSGTALDDRTVLTAAHCVEDLGQGVLSVGFGADRLSDQSLTAVTGIAPHPGYDSVEVFNDLAVLRTRDPMAIGSFPALATKVHAARARRASTRLTLYGWGQDHRGRLGRAVLKPMTRAARRQWRSGFRPSQQLAAGPTGRSAGRRAGACEGDSGGPLILGPRRHPVLVGVTSFGSGRCGGTSPTIFTSAGDFRSWILATIAAQAAAG